MGAESPLSAINNSPCTTTVLPSNFSGVAIKLIIETKWTLGCSHTYDL
jgi:hypothetical protein